MKRSFQSAFRASCSLKGLESDLENNPLNMRKKLSWTVLPVPFQASRGGEMAFACKELDPKSPSGQLQWEETAHGKLNEALKYLAFL